MSRWKIFDNLRRSLVPIALLLFLFGTWLVPGLGAWGALLVLAIVSLPGILSALVELVGKPEQLPWLMHLRGVGESTASKLGQIGLTLAFLPYEAFISLAAIARTLFRMLVTKKRLLEWQTSTDVARKAHSQEAILVCQRVQRQIARERQPSYLPRLMSSLMTSSISISTVSSLSLAFVNLPYSTRVAWLTSWVSVLPPWVQNGHA